MSTFSSVRQHGSNNEGKTCACTRSFSDRLVLPTLLDTHLIFLRSVRAEQWLRMARTLDMRVHKFNEPGNG
jgi:hypothetical protein